MASLWNGDALPALAATVYTASLFFCFWRCAIFTSSGNSCASRRIPCSFAYSTARIASSIVAGLTNRTNGSGTTSAPPLTRMTDHHGTSALAISIIRLSHWFASILSGGLLDRLSTMHSRSQLSVIKSRGRSEISRLVRSRITGIEPHAVVPRRDMTTGLHPGRDHGQPGAGQQGEFRKRQKEFGATEGPVGQRSVGRVSLVISAESSPSPLPSPPGEGARHSAVGGGTHVGMSGGVQ